MNLHYYKFTPEANKYKTWHFNDDVWSKDYGWNKLDAPSFADTSDEAKEWYKISNKEDLGFLTKELNACNQWYMDNIVEIIKAKKVGY